MQKVCISKRLKRKTIPPLGLGTWQLWGKECFNAVKLALEIGYRHIDTAFVYENHSDIGQAIRGFDREELFLTTKFGVGQVTREKVLIQVNDTDIDASLEQTCDLALKELATDYLDLFLIHWPDRNRPLEEILAGMHRLREKGKIRFVGVSNYTIHHLQNAYNAGLSIAFNQVEFHPYLFQKELLEFARAHQTELIAYRPFGKGRLIKEEPLFKAIGKNYQKTPGQVILRWLIQKKIPVIVKASSKQHLQENFDIKNFFLSEDEMEAIDLLNKNFRYTQGEWTDFDY